MRAPLTMSLAVSLLLAPAQALAGGDDASPAVGFGGRVEVPEAGFGLTLPDDCAYLRPQVAYDTNQLGEEMAFIEPLLSATAEEYQGFEPRPLTIISLRVTDTSVTEEICYVTTGSSHGKSSKYAGAMMLSGMRDWDFPTHLTTHELSVGEVARIYWDDRPAEPPTAGVTYFLVDGETLHMLTCMGDDRDEDGWLSIAQSFEFLPSE